jgi:hypothetical protein
MLQRLFVRHVSNSRSRGRPSRVLVNKLVELQETPEIWLTVHVHSSHPVKLQPQDFLTQLYHPSATRVARNLFLVIFVIICAQSNDLFINFAHGAWKFVVHVRSQNLILEINKHHNYALLYCFLCQCHFNFAYGQLNLENSKWQTSLLKQKFCYWIAEAEHSLFQRSCFGTNWLRARLADYMHNFLYV